VDFLLEIVKGTLKRAKILDDITEKFINDYNSLCKEETERLRQPDTDTQFSITIEQLTLEVLAKEILEINANNCKFSFQDDTTICSYTLELQSLKISAVQHRGLCILKLSQTSLLNSVNKLLKKRTIAIQNANTNVFIQLQMYFKIVETACEYFTWHNNHLRSLKKPYNAIEKIYIESKENELIKFSFLEILISEIKVKAMFNDNLLYLFIFEDIGNISKPTIKSPYVVYLD